MPTKPQDGGGDGRSLGYISLGSIATPKKIKTAKLLTVVINLFSKLNSVRRLYETLSATSPTLRSLPQNFTMRQFPSGAAVVMHPSFGTRSVVARVLRELGASDAAMAALPTSAGQIEVRQAREVADLNEEE